jgi:hypothetical protein
VDQVSAFLLTQGVLGVVVIGFLLGIIVPKWIIDEYRKREAVKDAIIERLTNAVERLADQAEAKK